MLLNRGPWPRFDVFSTCAGLVSVPCHAGASVLLIRNRPVSALECQQLLEGPFSTTESGRALPWCICNKMY